MDNGIDKEPVLDTRYKLMENQKSFWARIGRFFIGWFKKDASQSVYEMTGYVVGIVALLLIYFLIQYLAKSHFGDIIWGA